MTTESITLEGVCLGPFEIRLELRRLQDIGRRSPYLVIALDANPAATAENVAHPHVNDDMLCPRDASTAVNAALASGRLCDCFMIVQSVRNPYNSGSPYVRIEDDFQRLQEKGNLALP